MLIFDRDDGLANISRDITELHQLANLSVASRQSGNKLGLKKKIFDFILAQKNALKRRIFFAAFKLQRDVLLTALLLRVPFRKQLRRIVEITKREAEPLPTFK